MFLTETETVEITTLTNKILLLDIPEDIKKYGQYIYGACMQFIIEIEKKDYDSNIDVLKSGITAESWVAFNLKCYMGRDFKVSGKLKEYYDKSYCKTAFMIGVYHSLYLKINK